MKRRGRAMEIEEIEQQNEEDVPLFLKSPYPYPGGKSSIADEVWSRLGNTPNFVDPFAGSLSLLLQRPTQPKNETVNDADGMICNFWRAIAADPEAVAYYADWPVNELDLHSRHLWLVTVGKLHVEHLRSDPEYYDPKVAGWWVWGISQWIGSGWCTAWGKRKDGSLKAVMPRDNPTGVNATSKRRPHLKSSDGVHRQSLYTEHKCKLQRQAVGAKADLGIFRVNAGLAKKVPHVSDSGRGVHRPALSEQAPRLSGWNGVHRSSLAHKRPVVARPNRGIDRDSSNALYEYLFALSLRLRRVRVCCGDWTRVLGPSVTEHNGITAIPLDPPYVHDGRDTDLYGENDDPQIAWKVREWAIANGDNPKLRIIVFGYESEGYTFPESWEEVAWKSRGGYHNQGNNENRKRERFWCSPHCLKPNQGRLFE